LELFDAGQLTQIVKTEAKQEILGGAIENWAPHYSFSSSCRDELAIKQGGEHSAGVYAADFTNLRPGDRLLVCVPRQSLQCLHREPHRRLHALGKGANYIVVFRLGSHAVTIGYPANLHAARGVLVFGAKRVKLGLDFAGWELWIR